MLLHGDVGRLNLVTTVEAEDDVIIFSGGVLYRIDFDTFADKISPVENLNFRQTSTETTLTSSDVVLECTSGTFTVNLPTAVGITGRVYFIKNSGAGVVTVDPSGAELIDGAASTVLSTTDGIQILSTGSGWIIL